jgi:predicted amidohydrolase YtcJ
MILFCGLAVGQQPPGIPAEVIAYPDMIIYNAKLVTMDDHSFGLNTSVGTIAQAMAIRDGKVLAVGTNEQIQRMAGPRTDKMDAKGRMVMPGMIDTHLHAHNGILDAWMDEHPQAVHDHFSIYRVPTGKSDADLVQALTLVVKQHVQNTEPGRWADVEIAGGAGAGEDSRGVLFLSQKKFTKQMLDSLAPKHPVLLRAHPSYVVNGAYIQAISALYGKMDLESAGVDEAGRLRSTASQYRPNKGMFVDFYFQSRVPLLADLLEAGLKKHAAVGVTTYVSHIMGYRFLDAFNLMVRQKRMPVRFAWTHWFGFATGYGDSETFYRRVGDLEGMGSDYLWNMGVGLGAIDSGLPRICTTMEAPRAQKDLEWCQNGPGTREYETTKTAIANYQRVNVGHAEGDKGIDFFMDALEEAMRENPAITLDYVRSRRFSSDHCNFYPRIDALPRMGKLGMIISCSPGALTNSMEWIGPGKYPPVYVKQIAPIRSAIESGVMVTTEGESGVDRENKSPGRFGANVAFLTRKNENGVLVSPEETVDRNTLLKMMTNWAARFTMREDAIGSLEPGKWADFLVLSGDYFAGSPEAIADIHPLMTVVGGKVIVLKEEFAKELGREPVGPQVQFISTMAQPAAPQM